MADVKKMTKEEFEKFRESLLAELPEDVKEKISGIYSDVQLCKVLADSGIDLDAIEKKIENAGFNTRKIGVQLPDAELEGIAGGFYDDDYEDDVVCDHCDNQERKEFSKQIFASMFSKYGKFYRCRKCGYYTCIIGPGHSAILTPQQYRDR